MNRSRLNRSITTTSLRSHTAVASGFLHKLTHNGTPFARWHQRYYVLYTDGLLCSYKSSRARNSYRIIQVGRKCLRVRFGLDTRNDECNRWPKGVPRALCFSVINSDREYHFYCESEREFAIWRENLLQILGRLGSAHSSYVERRHSKLNGIANWLGDKSDDEYEASSIAPTIPSREETAWLEIGEEEDVQKWVEVDGYDTVGGGGGFIALPTDYVERGESAEGKLIHRDTQLQVGDDRRVTTYSSRDLAKRGSLCKLGDEDRSTGRGIECEELTDNRNTKTEKETETGTILNDFTDQCLNARDNASNTDREMSTENCTSGRAEAEVVTTKRARHTVVASSSSYSARQGIDVAFQEVQNIIDQTFNDMF